MTEISAVVATARAEGVREAIAEIADTSLWEGFDHPRLRACVERIGERVAGSWAASGDWGMAWAELRGYVSEAADDGRGIEASDLLQYMRELRRRYVTARQDAV